VQHLCNKQGHLPLEQVAQSPVQPDLEADALSYPAGPTEAQLLNSSRDVGQLQEQLPVSL